MPKSPLLNAYLVGTVDAVTYKAKSSELKAEAAKVDEAMAKMGGADPTERTRDN